MKNKICTLLICLSAFASSGQNLFPVTLTNCNTSSFCLDCGDIKGGVDEALFAEMLDKVETKLSLGGVSGGVYFQVLVESNGRACVLSHTDERNTQITKTIIKHLNKFKSWTPASTGDQLEDRTSINLLITINNNNLAGIVERVSMPAFEESLRGAKAPEISNDHYSYSNDHLENYSFTIWDRDNSGLKSDKNDNIALDSKGVLWYTMDRSLGFLKNGNFEQFEQDIRIVEGDGLNYSSLAIDNEDRTWVSTSIGIFSYDGQWKFLSPEEIGIDGAYDIVNNKLSGEVFFCSDEGLTIYTDGVWSNINQDVVPELPSNRVYFAKRDSKKRIWIGTFSGSVMIDSDGKATSFNESKTALKKQCITSLAEDSNGNLYFGLYEFDRKGADRNEGIAKWSIEGTWTQYTSDNSGMPFNHTSDMIYDAVEDVLWIATERAGLVRFDLNQNWENYHSENSLIPTSHITDLHINSKGVLYLGTRLGIVRIEKK